jgi:hypothetical protein
MTNTELLYIILGTTSLILIFMYYYAIKIDINSTKKVEEEILPVKDCIYTEPEEIIVKPKRTYKKRTTKVVVEAPVKKVRSVKKSITVE